MALAMSEESVDALLVFPPEHRLQNNRLDPPLGLLYLGTVLKQNGYRVHITDLTSPTMGSPEEATLPRSRLVGFSVWTTNLRESLELVGRMREQMPTDTVFVAGGPHATADPDSLLGSFDVVVRREGEPIILELVQKANRGEHPSGIIDGGIVRDLDALPCIDYSLVDLQKYGRTVDGNRAVSILTSRGCPYQCTFCNSIVMGKGVDARWRSPENVIIELDNIYNQYGIRSFRITDDIFTLKPSRLHRLQELLSTRPYTFRCFAKADRTDLAMARLLHQIGVRHVSIGVESGSDKILRLMKKGQTSEDIRTAIGACHEVGIKVRVYLIVGYPGESWETLQQTRDLMLECMPDEFAVYPIIAYPGTELHSKARELGIEDISSDMDDYYQVFGDREASYPCASSGLSRSDIKLMRTWLITELDGKLTWAGDAVLNK